jgi:hypothetical protein
MDNLLSALAVGVICVFAALASIGVLWIRPFSMLGCAGVSLVILIAALAISAVLH